MFARDTIVLSVVTALGVFASISAIFGQLVADDPEAMRKLATSVPKVDIVGVRLGMAPQEATAALKAANPAFKVDTLNLNLEKAGTSGSYDAAPHWLLAHTVGPVPRIFCGSSQVLNPFK